MLVPAPAAQNRYTHKLILCTTTAMKKPYHHQTSHAYEILSTHKCLLLTVAVVIAGMNFVSMPTS